MLNSVPATHNYGNTPKPEIHIYKNPQLIPPYQLMKSNPPWTPAPLLHSFTATPPHPLLSTAISPPLLLLRSLSPTSLSLLCHLHSHRRVYPYHPHTYEAHTYTCNYTWTTTQTQLHICSYKWRPEINIINRPTELKLWNSKNPI